MRRGVTGLGLLLVAFALVACGSGTDDASPGTEGFGSGSSDRTSEDRPSQPVERDELSFLTVTPFGVSRVEVESGEETEVVPAADLGLGLGEMLTLPRLHDGVLWLAVGPGHLVGVDPESGEIRGEVEFDSNEIVTDFAFGGDLLWVQSGFAFADAVLLALAPDSGELQFRVEMPVGSAIGGMAVGDEGVWLIGGDPETTTVLSRVEAGGVLTVPFETGLVLDHLALGVGGVWAGGNLFAVDGGEKSAVAHLDPASGELIATIEIGGEIGSIVVYNGAVWVSDQVGSDFEAALLFRIDPLTDEITDTIEVGSAGFGSLDLIAGGGYIFAINSIDRRTYVINAATAEVS